MPGRLTIGLWNSYDPRRFAEAHRRALARAAPLALAFDANLAVFGFPFHDLVAGGGRTAERRGERARADPRRGEDEPELDPKDPVSIARHVAASTSIGEGGAYFVELARAGRFFAFDYPKSGFPPQLGTPVLTTSKPEPGRAVGARELARELARSSLLLVFGLGPHGPGKDARALCRNDFDVTGRGASLETATAMGAVVAAIAEAGR